MTVATTERGPPPDSSEAVFGFEGQGAEVVVAVLA